MFCNRLLASVTQSGKLCNRLHFCVIDYNVLNYAQNMCFARCNRLQCDVIDYISAKRHQRLVVNKHNLWEHFAKRLVRILTL